jgi:hypothetical protein
MIVVRQELAPRHEENLANPSGIRLELGRKLVITLMRTLVTSTNSTTSHITLRTAECVPKWSIPPFDHYELRAYDRPSQWGNEHRYAVGQLLRTLCFVFIVRRLLDITRHPNLQSEDPFPERRRYSMPDVWLLKRTTLAMLVYR